MSDPLLLLLILSVSILLLAWKNLPADLVFGGALTLVILLGIIPVSDALSGFSNQGMLTVAALFIVAQGMRDTGAIHRLTDVLLRHPDGTTLSRSLLARLLFPVTLLSAFLNNTPIVASFIPALSDWARRYGISTSSIMIPMSYAAILGGTITVIGTSTNLVVNGLFLDQTGQTLSLFAPAVIGIPVALGGLLYLLLFSRQLLPMRDSAHHTFENTREYTIEMVVPSESPLIGKTIQEAGLRQLNGLFLAEINRGDRLIAAVDPSERLQAGDQLVFTGVVDAVADLQSIQGLAPATRQVFKLDAPRHQRQLVEAVVSGSNPLLGLTIKEGEFRHRFDAVVLAVCRNAERINQKVGDIRLRAGDVLLIEAPRDFFTRFRSSSDFLLLNRLSDSPVQNNQKAGTAWAILLTMVLVAALGWLSMFQASLLAVAGMMLTKTINLSSARRSVDWQVLLVIACSIGLGQAVQITGLGQWVANGLLSISPVGSSEGIGSLIAVYVITWILTELMTNNAAAVLVFPIALATAVQLDVSVLPFVMTILFAASASFATPIGYQTNLMVMGPGGYRYGDFLKIGLPLNLVVAMLTLWLIPRFFPF